MDYYANLNAADYPVEHIIVMFNYTMKSILHMYTTLHADFDNDISPFSIFI